MDREIDGGREKTSIDFLGIFNRHFYFVSNSFYTDYTLRIPQAQAIVYFQQYVSRGE